MPGPSTILLLHGLGGSGEGSVRMLEERLRARGWGEARYVRPTVPSAQRTLAAEMDEARFKAALAEVEAALSGQTPDLAVGFSFGGLLAAFTPARLCLAVASPWHRLPREVLEARAAQGRLAALFGGKDSVVPLEANLAALPAAVSREVDPEGGHAFEAWMDRIAAWVQARAAPGLP
jgi:pimeloyl-ACP methyl ester carboxylesterase